MKVCVVIGNDSRMPEVAKVCAFSIKQRSTINMDIKFLDLGELRKKGIYWRQFDPLASTEFTYSRFLTPYLAKEFDIAVYCDNDFLWLADPAHLVKSLDPSKAVHCVWHDYQPAETIKMDGIIQTQYPRKYWSSLMVFNIGDSRLRVLTPKTVNTASGSYLHQFKWLNDSAIGRLESDWNWLEGTIKPCKGYPKVVHFTRGGPWFENWTNVEFADLWTSERDKMINAVKQG